MVKCHFPSIITETDMKMHLNHKPWPFGHTNFVVKRMRVVPEVRRQSLKCFKMTFDIDLTFLHIYM